MTVDEIAQVFNPMFQQILDRLDRIENQYGAAPVTDIRIQVNALDITRKHGAEGLKELARQQRTKEGKK